MGKLCGSGYQRYRTDGQPELDSFEMAGEEMNLITDLLIAFSPVLAGVSTYAIYIYLAKRWAGKQ